jgi:hypothetical protein
MEYDHIIHNTSALDDAMKAASERERMDARSRLNRTRAGLLLSGTPLALIAGLALVGAAAAAAWIMHPHFDFHDVVIEVPKLTVKPFDLPKPVEKQFDLPVPMGKPFDLPIPVARPTEAHKPASPPTPGSGPVAKNELSPTPPTFSPFRPEKNEPSQQTPHPDAAPLPPKTPDQAEQKFLDRPDYKSARLKGRIVKSYDDGLHFDNGSAGWPVKNDDNGKAVRDANGKVMLDPSLHVDSDPYVGDYGYCNLTPGEPDVFDCYAIHNDQVVELPPLPRQKQAEAAPKPTDQPSRTASNKQQACLADRVLADLAGKPQCRESTTPMATEMVSIDVNLGDGRVAMVKAMVDKRDEATLVGHLASKSSRLLVAHGAARKHRHGADPRRPGHPRWRE